MADFQVVVVGAGLVGALSAISFARQGYKVALYESRSDPRQSKSGVGRSINLAVSARGLEAIASVDPELCERVIAKSLPMRGRMIHNGDQQQSQIYGLFGECINSIDRSQLNWDLLNEAAAYPSVKLYFNHKLTSCDFSKHQLSFTHTSDDKTENIQVHADLTVGCDGAYSAVRTAMMKLQRTNFTQEYIEHAYLELAIPPSPTGTFLLDAEHLHIWPRQEFMLIALPNPDKSFTSTLFAPFSLFDSFKADSAVVDFFQAQFPDALAMIGEEELLGMWHRNPIAPLIQIKCFPYHFQDSAILLGDATHAMVPFYGQGMNCGFEDLRILNSILRKHGVTPSSSWELQAALKKYSDQRHPDLLAILELAMGNYVEMRSSVTSRLYLLRKYVDGILGRLFKDSWVPMYSMVSFRADIPYAEVVKREARQASIVTGLTSVISIASVCTVATIVLHATKFRSWRNVGRMILKSMLE